MDVWTDSWTRALLAALALVTAVAALAACGQERSAEAFCSTMKAEKARILDQFETNVGGGADDPLLEVLTGLGASVQALGELRTYFNKLADAAPEEVREPAEIVAETYEEQIDNATENIDNPLAGLASTFISSLTVSGQMNQLHNFALENCGEGI